MSTPKLEVIDANSAQAFIKWCVDELGIAYHPDTCFEDYIDLENHGRRHFTSEEARTLAAMAANAHLHCDPYKVGLAEFDRLVQEQARQQ